MKITTLFLMLIVVSSGPVALAATWHVPGDFSTIAQAMVWASGGDMIVLGDGVYYEHDLMFNEEFIICSESGNPESCIIDCQGGAGSDIRGFFFENVGRRAQLLSVTVRNGWWPT